MKKLSGLPADSTRGQDVTQLRLNVVRPRAPVDLPVPTGKNVTSMDAREITRAVRAFLA